MSKFLVSLHSLDDWFRRQKRVLPWRDFPTPYFVWISEIMLQQTQVVTVIPYFEKFISRFPSVEKLAEASEEDVLQYWAGLGYYSRARNLHKAARQIVTTGRFPATREEWLNIPGVGPYTAGAILSIAENQIEPILDGNVERVLSRIRKVDRQKGDLFFKARLWKLSKIFVESAAKEGIWPRNLNQALMELGALICSPKKPKCLICPVRKFCRASRDSVQEEFPPKKKAKEWLRISEKVFCITDSSGRMLLRRREKGEWRSGLWDFPDKFPEGLSKKKAVKIFELSTQHVVTRHKIQRTTEVWKIPTRGAPVSESIFLQARSPDSPTEETCLRWVEAGSPTVPVGSPVKKSLPKILKILEGETQNGSP